MSWLPESKDHLPLTWWKQTPIYLAALLAISGAASMVLTTFLLAGAPDAVEYLTFSYADLARLHLWSAFTYILVNPPSLWLLLGCYMLWRFGEAVERHLGRRSFVLLLVLLLLVSPALITLAGLLGSERGCSGMMQLEFGVFIAFATLYPRAQVSLIFVTLEVWMLAAIFVGISALSLIAMRDGIGLMILAGQVGTASAFIRYQQGLLTLPELATMLPKRSAPKPRPQAQPTMTKKSPMPAPAVDDILEKISREGIQSLTEAERKALDEASAELQKRKD